MPWYDFRGRHGVLRENKPKAEWAIDSEATRAIGMIVLVKSNLLVKNIENKKLFNPFLPPKSPCFLLLVGYNI